MQRISAPGRIGDLAVALWLLIVFLSDIGAIAREPERGSPERTAILGAVRSLAERDLGPPVVFTVHALNVENGWAYLNATPRRSDRDAIDWSRTKFAQPVQSGFMSDLVLALLHDEGGQWRVVEYILGPTDVAWEGWLRQHKLSRTLFAPSPGSATGGSAPPTQPGGLTWTLGELVVWTPAGWSSPEGPPTALRLGGAPWLSALASQPQAVERGVLVTLSWASPDAIYSTSLDARHVQQRGAATLAGRAATRTEFLFRDAYNDTQGVDIVTREPVAGGLLHAGCRAPSGQWAGVKATCERILASVSLKVAAPEAPPGPASPAPVAPPAAAPPGPRQGLEVMLDGLDMRVVMGAAGAVFLAFIALVVMRRRAARRTSSPSAAPTAAVPAPPPVVFPVDPPAAATLPAPEKRFCTECGADVTGARFCHQCGAPTS